MSLSNEQRERIRLYLLEKIDQKQPAVIQKTADAFAVTPATVYKYLDALIAEEWVRKQKRGAYEMVSKTKTVRLSRAAGEIASEQTIYDRYIRPELNDLPANVVGIWDYLCSEMLNNVIDHSGAETLTIEVSRDALNTRIRLSDNGVGVFEKIRAFLGLSSVQEAAGELLKGKLTTDAKRHSGEGIFFSSRLADVFVILSSGQVFSYHRFEEAASCVPETEAKGTTVFMQLSNRSKKQAKDVFDRYAEVDGDFTRTHIPLRNYFESAPVSRSQAKRLCAGLERFSEVELDFEGLDWMGQGFAHQLFVVFAAEHPQVRLIPVNMVPDVAGMHRHVTAAR